MVRKGENIYQRKDGRWEGRYIKGRKYDNKIVYGYIYGERYSEVKEKLLAQKLELANNDYKVTTKDNYYIEWLIHEYYPTILPKLKKSTAANYWRIIQRYLRPYFVGIPFRNISGKLLQEFITTLHEQGLSSSSIRLIFSLVCQSLKDAQNQQLLKNNPLLWLKFPRDQKKIVNALNVKQQNELEELAKNDKNGLSILLSLYAGLRIGEISGLTWSDIDFERKLISINKTVTRIASSKQEGTRKTTVIIDSPKTGKSARLVPLSSRLEKILWQEKQYGHPHFLITSKNGLAEPRVIGYRFKQLIKNTDFSNIHFHVLRHTFATRAIEYGMDIVSLSKILGHQSTQLTLDTYIDSMLEQRQKEMNKMDQYDE